MSRLPGALRRAVQERAGGLCEYCYSQVEVTGHEFTVDHIFPQARGGKDDLENLCVCCSGCNTYKQARTEAPDPRTRRVVPLFHPRRDEWHEHFRWSPTLTRVIGKSAIGRATVDALRLNRPSLDRDPLVHLAVEAADADAAQAHGGDHSVGTAQASLG